MKRKNSIKLWPLMLVCFGLMLAYFIYNGQGNYKNASSVAKAEIVDIETTTLPPALKESNDSVPLYVRKTYEYILQHGDAPPGYFGGRTFQNREKRLPIKERNGTIIQYREWDVHPRNNGVDRGAERLVTGSDKSAWFTNDHYRTFFLFDRK